MTVFSPLWYIMVGSMLVATVTITFAARVRPGHWTVAAGKGLAAVLFATALVWLVTTLSAERLSWATSLPLPLCDLAAFVAGVALWTRRQVLVDLTYYWGIAGTLQGLLTPDLPVGAASYTKVEYLITHTVVVLAAVYLVAGMRLYPARWAGLRVIAVTAVYTAIVGAVDAATGGNYMFLARRPGSVTLLNALGPWPWYLLSAAGVAVLLVAVLSAPFVIARRWEPRWSPGPGLPL